MSDYIVQNPPFCVQVELTEGCSLFCDFCGLQGIRERPMKNLKFMSVETATKLAMLIRDAKWNPRLEFAMHGEPTLNPDIFKIIETFRELCPKLSIMVCSNGSFVRDQRFESPADFIHVLRRSGANILAIDAYEYSKGFWMRIRDALDADPSLGYAWYPYNRKSTPHARSDPIMFRIVFIRDISNETSGTHASLNTHCGSAFPPRVVMKPCGKPFRELSVRWDGGVAICCNDWRGEYVIGNTNDIQSMHQLWHEPRFIAARRKLLHGQRDFTPCNKCDALTYRPGLLPDPKGVKTLQPASEGDEAIIKFAIEQGPLTKPVLREWEK